MCTCFANNISNNNEHYSSGGAAAMNLVDDVGAAGGEGWGDDAELVLDDGKQSITLVLRPTCTLIFCSGHWGEPELTFSFPRRLLHLLFRVPPNSQNSNGTAQNRVT